MISTPILGTHISGPLNRNQIVFFVYNVASVQQFQPHDEFTVAFITASEIYFLTAEPLANVIDYLHQHQTNSELARHLTVLQAGIKIKPKPEPEVVAARPKLALEPEAEAISPRWTARIRTKLWGGHVHEETHQLVGLDDLEGVIDRNPQYTGEIKNIKIKLEYQI